MCYSAQFHVCGAFHLRINHLRCDRVVLEMMHFIDMFILFYIIIKNVVIHRVL